MKLTELLRTERPQLSFEVFPPKSRDGYDTVAAAAEQIAALRPAFMSVTYGAGGGTSAYTLSLARDIRERFGVPSVAHLTCVSSTRATVAERIRELRAAGIENVLALRGDVPEERRHEDRSLWDYRYAATLVAELKAADPTLCVGGACYPEMHPESASRADDIRYLKEKVDAGCDFLTTQMFFDNNILYSFLYKIREAGITVPVIPGIMPITSASFVRRVISVANAFLPQRFLSILDRFGSDPAAMRAAGIAYATDQIVDLFANGHTCVHVYSMNKPDVASAIFSNVAAILGR